MITSTFQKELNSLLSGDTRNISTPLIIGKPSEILCKCGADKDKNITITKRVIDKSMRPEIRNEYGRITGNTGHGLSLSQIIMAISELEKPIMVFRGRNLNSLLVITSIIDQKSRNIVIAIELNRMESFSQINSIRSIYGRDNLGFYIGQNIDKGNLLAANKEKADEMLHSIGKSYPKENTFINFN